MKACPTGRVGHNVSDNPTSGGAVLAEPPAGTTPAGVQIGAGPAGPVVFNDYYKANHSRAVGLAYLLTQSRHAAEDLAQDAMAATYKHWDNVENPDAYLRTCVVNGARRWRMRTARSEAQLPSNTAAADPQTDELWDILARLPKKQRIPLVLHFYEDLTYIEISKLLHTREGTVKSRISRALETLRKEVPR